MARPPSCVGSEKARESKLHSPSGGPEPARAPRRSSSGPGRKPTRNCDAKSPEPRFAGVPFPKVTSVSRVRESNPRASDPMRGRPERKTAGPACPTENGACKGEGGSSSARHFADRMRSRAVFAASATLGLGSRRHRSRVGIALAAAGPSSPRTAMPKRRSSSRGDFTYSVISGTRREAGRLR